MERTHLATSNPLVDEITWRTTDTYLPRRTELDLGDGHWRTVGIRTAQGIGAVVAAALTWFMSVPMAMTLGAMADFSTDEGGVGMLIGLVAATIFAGAVGVGFLRLPFE